MKKNIVFTLIVWISLFLVVEIGLRSYDFIRETIRSRSKSTYNPASIFVPHPFMAYAANPAHSDHNQQGYRAEKTRTYPTDPDATNIVCLGGSSTYGTRVSREFSYPHLLEARLAEATRRKVNVINGGLGGYSTPNIISLLSLKLVHHHPDIVIFYVGFNDAWNRLLFSDFEPDYSHAQKSWQMPEYSFWRSCRCLDKLASLLGYPSPRNPHLHTVAWHRKNGDPEENLRSSSGAAFRENLETLVGISRTHGAVPVLVTQAMDFQNHPLAAHNKQWMEAMDDHTQIIKQVAAEMSVHLIDLRSLMADQELYFADVLHMSEDGNRRRAKVIAEYLTTHHVVSE